MSAGGLTVQQQPITSTASQRFRQELAYSWRQVKRHRWMYAFLLPTLLYFIIFHYIPMYGIVIAFKDYSPFVGIADSPWVGLKHFERFFQSIFFSRLLRNTLFLNVYSLIFGFPLSIVLALMLNEVRSHLFRRTIQTVSYLPYFISTVVVVGMIVNFLSTSGLVNIIIKKTGALAKPFLSDPRWFRSVYVATGIWQNVGWGSVIYLAALASIDPQLYDAAMVDGAGRFQKIWHISLPSILPVIMILLLFNLGGLLSVGFEKVVLLYNPAVYETADVISTYVYRAGLLGQQLSFGTAVGLFNSIVNLVLLTLFNQLAKRFGQQSLW